MTRRICFDTASSFYWNKGGNTHCVRAGLRNSPIRFDCAVIYDSGPRKYRQFGPTEAEKLLKALAKADELVTINGLRCDMIVLEHACGLEEVTATLWKITHVDLSGWHSTYGLNNLVSAFLPDHLKTFARQKRLAETLEAKPKGPLWKAKLPGCRTDAEFTWRLYQEYAKLDQTECTFSPDYLAGLTAENKDQEKSQSA